jgi:iron complex transport system substrate-binding protein
MMISSLKAIRISIPVLSLLLLFSGRAWAGVAVDIRYSKNFSVEQKDGVTLVSVRHPRPGAGTDFHYLLKPRGSVTPKGFAGCQVVEVPVKRSVVLSTTFVAFMDRLGTIDTMVGFADLQRLHNQAVHRAAKAGRIVEVGQGPNLRIETILDLQPEMIFTFASGGFYDVHPKLFEAGFKVAVCAEYMESHPLGRAEWIKFFALFFGREKEALKIFSVLEQRYQHLAAIAAKAKIRPSVVTNAPFQGRWHVSGGKSYMGRFLADAGAEYIWAHTGHTGSIPMDVELVYARGVEAEYWLNTSVWQSLNDANQADPRLKGFKALKAKRLYNNNRRVNKDGGNDFWESGMMAPDVILADLIRIFHPELLPEHELYYYQLLK